MLGVPARQVADSHRLGCHHVRTAGVDALPCGLVRVRRHDRAVRAAVVAAHRVAALVVVLVPGEDQVHLVAVEQRQPRAADAQVGAVRAGRGQRALVHEHDDHVDVRVAARLRERALEPERLHVRPATAVIGHGRVVGRAELQVTGVAVVVKAGAVRDRGAGRGDHGRGIGLVPEVAGRTVLVDDVVGVEADELDGADPEGVEVAAQVVAVVVGQPVVRQQEPAQVVAVAVGAVPVVARGALGGDAARRLAGPAGAGRRCRTRSRGCRARASTGGSWPSGTR